MNRERLRLALAQYESCNLQRHEVQGIDHIGYGINLETPLPDELLDYLGVEDEDDIQEITQEQADYLFDHFITIAHSDAVRIYGEDVFSALSPLRQEVLINLSYNLGLSRLKAFRKMNKAVIEGDYNEAALQMLDSKAARQTGDRYEKLSAAFTKDNEVYLELPRRFDAVADTIPDETDSEPDDPELAEGLKSADTVDLLKSIQKTLNELLRRAGG